jgi:hypothetical protein
MPGPSVCARSLDSVVGGATSTSSVYCTDPAQRVALKEFKHEGSIESKALLKENTTPCNSFKSSNNARIDTQLRSG